VVEIDPYDPHSRPVKRTALGRFKHEAAMVTLAEDGRVVVYMGDDERFEYMYKFVSRRRFDPKDRASNRTLLDDGTLYAARFDDNGQGQWIALPARPEALIQTRQAADSVGASKMDRPEWVAVHPRTGDVYLALTNNDRRGTPGQPAVDAANPRAQNVYGQILKWREQGGDAASLKFRWEMFALAGEERGFGSPERGAVDPDRRCRGGDEPRALREDRQQPDARRRREHRRDPPLPHRAHRVRDHRRGNVARWPHALHQRAASGRTADGEE
jgi:uncharacterized protein